MAKSPRKKKKISNEFDDNLISKKNHDSIVPKTIEEYVKLINIVRYSKNKKSSDDAFYTIIRVLHPKIQQISYRFNIPGYSKSDIYQEALVAIRYKAIKSYNPKKSNFKDIPSFLNFTTLCIVRHLSTKLKSSYQNRSHALNNAVSFDRGYNSSNSANGNNNNDDELHLIDIIQEGGEDNVLSLLGNKEYRNILFSSLYEKLSEFEKEVFYLYSQKYSYDEIARRIMEKYSNSEDIKIKSIDNALSRIKIKAKSIFDKLG